MRFRTPRLKLNPAPFIWMGQNPTGSGGVTQPPTAANPALTDDNNKAIETEDGRVIEAN